MKLFRIVLTAYGILAAIAIALGYYWHVYTLAICAALVYALKHESNDKTSQL